MPIPYLSYFLALIGSVVLPYLIVLGISSPKLARAA